MSARVTEVVTRTMYRGGLEVELTILRAGPTEYHEAESPNPADVPADIREVLAAWLNGADR